MFKKNLKNHEYGFGRKIHLYRPHNLSLGVFGSVESDCEVNKSEKWAPACKNIEIWNFKISKLQKICFLSLYGLFMAFKITFWFVFCWFCSSVWNYVWLHWGASGSPTFDSEVSDGALWGSPALWSSSGTLFLIMFVWSVKDSQIIIIYCLRYQHLRVWIFLMLLDETVLYSHAHTL